MRKQQEMEARCFFRVLNMCNTCKAHNYIILNFVVEFDHEDLGQVLAGFPSTIVIYNDPCIVVLNQICQIHSEIYQSKHLRFSDSHLQMCLLILILVNHSYLFHCPVPQVVWKPGFLAIFATFLAKCQVKISERCGYVMQEVLNKRNFIWCPSFMSHVIPLDIFKIEWELCESWKIQGRVSCWLNCETWWNQLYQNASMFADVLTWRFWSLWCHLWPEALRVTQGWDGWEGHFPFLFKDQFDSCSGRSIFVPI